MPGTQHQIPRFPRVIGCVDGTHIKIQAPGGEDAKIYGNRKGYFSMHVQVVSDAHLRNSDIVCRWLGSTHDVTIFNNSRICARFELGEFDNSLLLGDSGYIIKPFLLTPVLNQVTRAEQLLNESQIRPRNTVERCFGVWKRRSVLAYGMICSLYTTLAAVVSTAVLHNIAVNATEDSPPPLKKLMLMDWNISFRKEKLLT